MANTINTLGEQATLDRLIAHTLTDYEDDRITALRSYAFYNNTVLESVNLPSLISGQQYCFDSCYNLQSVSLPEATFLGPYAFGDCYRLESLNIPKIDTLDSRCFDHCYALNNLDLSNITKVRNYALEDNGFGTITLPSCTSLGIDIGYGGTRVSTVDLTNNITLVANNFRQAFSLVHLILRSNTLCQLSNTTAFIGTPIANGLGWIYVPSDLVNTYKNASNWSSFASQIVPISEYPKALQNETITDSWSQIFQAQDNGTYKTKYNIGDIKYCNIGGTYVPMQIIAFDKDVLSNDTSLTAKITWLSKGTSIKYIMNFSYGNYNRLYWTDCACRAFLRNVIYPQIESVVKNRIVPVNKSYKYYVNSSRTTSITPDTIWLPSYREIFGGGTSSAETNGVTYTDFFTNPSSRVKYGGMSQTANTWALRSHNGSFFDSVISSGGSGSAGSGIYHLAIGFCTN